MMRGDPNEPERWIISADAPPELRALLEVARREGPSLAQKASLGSRLGLSLQQALVGLGTKSVAVGTIALAVATGAGLGLYTGEDPAPPVSATVSAPERPALVPVESAPPAPVSVAEPGPPAPAPQPEAVRQHAAKRPTEASLIRSARDSLSTSTRQARTFLERHRRLYPQGQLAQEREVLLIEVLRLEGHEAEASARATEFRQKNPDSAHRPVAPRSGEH